VSLFVDRPPNLALGQKIGQGLPKRMETSTLSKNCSQRITQKEVSMDKWINFLPFMGSLFDDEKNEAISLLFSLVGDAT
jgi:hypothetical protein